MIDWSDVKWFVYDAPGGVRVMRHEQKPKSMRKGERLAATVVGVPRKTVTRLLKMGVRPGDIQQYASKFAEAQHARGADGRRPNLYREWVAKIAAEKRAYKESRAA